MFRKALLIGAAALLASVVTSYAIIGTPPGTGFALPDGNWLNGLANGHNRSAQYGITAHAGGTKAAAFQLPAQVAQLQVDTVASTSDSVLLPPCGASGIEIVIANAGANTLSIYGKGTDTINAAATANNYDLTTNTNAVFWCVKSGLWRAIKGS